MRIIVTLSISQIIRATLTSFLVCPYEFIGNVRAEVGIYKRKQEREKEGKHAFDQEKKKRPRKKEKTISVKKKE